MSEDPHFVHAAYTNADDGIWLVCKCNWSHNMGFAPTPAEMWAKEQAHRAEMAGEPIPPAGTVVQ